MPIGRNILSVVRIPVPPLSHFIFVDVEMRGIEPLSNKFFKACLQIRSICFLATAVKTEQNRP